MTATASPPTLQAPDVTGYKGPADIAGQIQLAEALAKAELVVPEEYRGKFGDILALIQTAVALDIPVMTAIHNLFFEKDGGGGMSAQLMGALLRRGGADWDITIDPGKSCVLFFRFSDGRAGGEMRYTMADARAAEIAGTDNWVRFPTENLYARCLARAARWLAQDMLQGWGYLPGERAEKAPAGGSAEAPPNDVPEEVTAFLSSVTPAATVADLRALLKTAKSKKVNLAGEYAGGGQTVEEFLLARIRVAAAREAGQIMEAAVDANTTAAADRLADGPPGAAVLNQAAGEGNLTCGCPSFRVIASGGQHDPDVCNGNTGE